MTRRIVIVGASLAGASAATTLRELGFDGDVDVVGAETTLPYERPGLSKGYLAGEQSSDDLLVNAPEVYAGFGIELHLGATAVGLDVARRVVDLADGTSLGYDAVVIATGSVNRRPPLPGMDLDGVHQLRTVTDADRLRAHATSAGRAVVVGQGFIGCEVAATLRGRGLDVTMIDQQPGPLHGPLGPEVSGRVAAWHREHGVLLVNDVGIEALTGNETVEGVRLTDGRVLPADLVVVGVGARPASDWLADAGLQLSNRAVAVDADGRSSAPDVYSIGDVSAWWSEELHAHRRVEHYDSALMQGQRVAHSLVGSAAPAPARSWFWSEQYSHTVQHAGAHGPGDELLWRGSSTGFWVRGDLVTAVVALDDGRQFRRALSLINLRPARESLRDEAVDLRTLRDRSEAAVA